MPREFRVSTRPEEGRSRGVGGKTEWKLSEVNTRAVSEEENELIGKFNMAVGNVRSKRIF